MLDGKIEKIVIVGGGSAGWMTAAYLCKALPDIKITLVESSDIPVIGVGEATIATISGFLAVLGLKEEDWMPFCNATYKYQIRFKNWYQVGDDYWHPFEPFTYYDKRLHLGQYWYLKHLLEGGKNRESLYEDCALGVGLAKQNRILRRPNTPEFMDIYNVNVNGDDVQLRIPYAYHFDAGLFGEYLKKNIAIPGGVEQIVEHIEEVHQDDRGFIDYLKTRSGKKLEGDLFIDCSGFRAMLIDKVMKEPFIPFYDTLYCDKAMAIRVPYEDIRQELEPFTTATAMSAGWIWNTPLTSRRGTGYVYCSAFEDKDDAEMVYRRFLGEEKVKDVEPNYIDIRVGKHKRTWVKNCVAIGLSAGFIEPLESTGLHFIYGAVATLANAISGRVFNVPVMAGYNTTVTRMLEEARDFLAIHYALTSREDTPFWRDVKYNTQLSVALEEQLAQYKNGFPNHLKNLIFSEHSWTCILTGMNYLPAVQSYVALNTPAAEKQFLLMRAISDLKGQLQDSAIHHYDYLIQRAQTREMVSS